MSTKIFVLFSFLFMFSCSTTKKNTAIKTTDSEDTSSVSSNVILPENTYLFTFLNLFEEAVRSHNASGVMRCMDKNYRTEQHDSFLKGNTSQFLNEFFSGLQANGNGYAAIDFTKITSIKRTDIKLESGYYTIYYTIVSEGLTINTSWVLLSKLKGDSIIFGFYGPVG